MTTAVGPCHFICRRPSFPASPAFDDNDNDTPHPHTYCSACCFLVRHGGLLSLSYSFPRSLVSGVAHQLMSVTDNRRPSPSCSSRPSPPAWFLSLAYAYASIRVHHPSSSVSTTSQTCPLRTLRSTLYYANTEHYLGRHTLRAAASPVSRHVGVASTLPIPHQHISRSAIDVPLPPRSLGFPALGCLFLWPAPIWHKCTHALRGGPALHSVDLVCTGTSCVRNVYTRPG